VPDCHIAQACLLLSHKQTQHSQVQKLSNTLVVFFRCKTTFTSPTTQSLPSCLLLLRKQELTSDSLTTGQSQIAQHLSPTQTAKTNSCRKTRTAPPRAKGKRGGEAIRAPPLGAGLSNATKTAQLSLPTHLRRHLPAQPRSTKKIASEPRHRSPDRQTSG
jgi:hypothetical protein